MGSQIPPIVGESNEIESGVEVEYDDFFRKLSHEEKSINNSFEMKEENPVAIEKHYAQRAYALNLKDPKDLSNSDEFFDAKKREEFGTCSSPKLMSCFGATPSFPVNINFESYVTP